MAVRKDRHRSLFDAISFEGETRSKVRNKGAGSAGRKKQETFCPDAVFLVFLILALWLSEEHGSHPVSRYKV